RQPGARRRRRAGMVVCAARPSVFFDPRWENGRERDRWLVDRTGAMEECLEVSGRSDHVAKPDQRERDGAVLPLDWRREGFGRRPAVAGDGAKLLSVVGEARRAFFQQAVDRQTWRVDGTAHADLLWRRGSLPGTAFDRDAAEREWNVLRAAGRK